MTAITTIAQRIIDENNYAAPGDITLTNMEYLIKNACDYINLQAGTTITFTPAAGVATLTATDAQIPVIKLLSALYLRAYKDRGPNASIGSISVSSIRGDPQFTIFWKQVEDGISRLRGRSFERA